MLLVRRSRTIWRRWSMDSSTPKTSTHLSGTSTLLCVKTSSHCLASSWSATPHTGLDSISYIYSESIIIILLYYVHDINLDIMNGAEGLWCSSSTVWLLSAQTRMNMKASILSLSYHVMPNLCSSKKNNIISNIKWRGFYMWWYRYNYTPLIFIQGNNLAWHCTMPVNPKN